MILMSEITKKCQNRHLRAYKNRSINLIELSQTIQLCILMF